MGHWDTSALAEHSKYCQLNVDWEHFETLSTQPNYYHRCIVEALEIQKEEVCNIRNPIINDRAGLYVTTDAWKPLFTKIFNK